MSKHTEGPWEVDLETGEIVAQESAVLGTIYGADDFPCLDEDEINEKEWLEECRANANLISAAPDLFKASKSLVDWLTSPGRTGKSRLERIPKRLREDLEVALGKADQL